MTDFSFDFQLWDTWRSVIFWSVRGIGLVSALWALQTYRINSMVNTRPLAILVFTVLIFMLGLFPIEWGYGTDRANYAGSFIHKYKTEVGGSFGDSGFILLSKFLSLFLDVRQYFVALAFIYIANYYIAINKLVKEKSFWLTAAVVSSFGFTAYVTNTMRAGLALSFVVLSFACYPLKKKMILCMLIAVCLHLSSVIPVIMIVISYYCSRTRLFYKLWLLAIPLSFLAGEFFMSYFAAMSDDSRTSYLNNMQNTSYQVGFRVDFIIYSLTPIIIGYYFIFKKKFRDNFYTLLYNSYILTNIFWILVIRANYTDRFAYLSWFMMPFIMVYPLLKQKLSLKENAWLGSILLGETAFGFLI